MLSKFTTWRISALALIISGLSLYSALRQTIGTKPNLKIQLLSTKYTSVDKDILGKSTWYLLHSMASNYNIQNPTYHIKKDIANMMVHLSKIYPCEKCVTHFQRYLQKFPMKMERQGQLSWWFCNFHNAVNYRLKKPLYDCIDLYSNNGCSTCVANS